MTWFGATALIEPLALAGGIATFLLMASWAAAPVAAERHARARGSVERGPLAVDATLSQSKLEENEAGTVLLHVRLRGAPAPTRLPIDVALVLDVAATMG